MEVGGSLVTRMRLVGWQIQPVIMADDGENLKSIPVDPIFVPAKDFADFDPDNALEPIRAQVEGYQAISLEEARSDHS